MKKKIGFVGVLLCTGMLLVGCGEKEKTSATKTTTSSTSSVVKESKETVYPLKVTVKDMNGKEYVQTFEKAPERAVTNNLSSTEILLALGLKDKIVGTMKPDNKVTGKYEKDIDSLPIIGDKMSVSKEKILERTPDIVLGRSMVFTDQSMGSIATFNDLGIQTYVQTASDMKGNPPLTSIIDDVRMLGKIFNKNDAAEKYAKEIEAHFKEVKDSVSKNKPEKEFSVLPMVQFDSAKSTYRIFNISGSVQSDLLKQLHMHAAVDGKNANPSFETIISANPDIILYVTTDRNAAFDKNAVETIKKEPLLKEVSAIKNDRIYTIAYDDFMDYSVRLFDTIDTLSKQVYGK